MSPRPSLALVLALLVGCGSSAADNADRGEPPDASAFNPGSGGTNHEGSGDMEPPPTPPGVFDWRDAVVYFVFVDRFFRDPTTSATARKCGPTPGVDGAGDWYGGNWPGVTAKIESGYFTDLGVNTLWVTVPFKNADTVAGHGVGGDTHNYSAYHGYWPLDPSKTEDCFGTPSDLKALVDAAHRKGLKIVFDYAMVHVHASSGIFKDHPDWFWPNSKNGSPDCICKGKNEPNAYCNWDDDYQRCWFTEYLPHWNYTNGAARDFSVEASVKLVEETQADGYRLDAIKHVDTSWLTQLRAAIDARVLSKQSPRQRFYMVGETYDFGDRDFIKSFVDPKTKLDGQFDFPLRLNLVKAIVMRQGQYGLDKLAGFMDSNDGFYGAGAVMSTFVGNHDLGRIIHMAEDQPRWDEYDNGSKSNAWSSTPKLPGSRSAFERVANAFAVLFTTKGAPLVYYGDEIGLPGAGDPDNRRPMQFDDLDPNQQFLLERVKTLAKVRAAHPALRRGNRTTIKATADVWVYTMKTSDEPADVVTVAINRSDAPQTVDGLPAGLAKELLTGTALGGSSIVLPPRQARVLVK